jgi:hypothetical protein
MLIYSNVTINLPSLNGGKMSKFIYLITILLFLGTIGINAAVKEMSQKTKTSGTANSNIELTSMQQKQMKNLENQRRILSLKTYQLRIKLISEDSELLMMHNQIMKLHKKLAIELNNNDEMKELSEQSNAIDKKIIELMQTQTSKIKKES